MLTGKTEVAKQGNDGAWAETAPDPTTATAEGDAKGTVGVPGFWLQAMANHGMLQETIAEEDVGALEYLADVRCIDKEDYTVRVLGAGFGLI